MGMTAKELIEHLKAFDEDAQVYLSEGMTTPLYHLKEVRFTTNAHRAFLIGDSEVED